MIERTDDGEVAVLRLAHGPVNALDAELCDAIAAQFRALVADPARAVVLTGTGRAFSAGADLRRVVGPAVPGGSPPGSAEGVDPPEVLWGEPYIRRFVPALDGLFRSVFELGKPVVAAVNGHAIAGGCVLAACADVTLMSGGRIGVPELAVGVPFPRVALEVLRYAVGDAGTRRLVLGTQTYPADEARALGLVDEVLPADDLLPAALERARAMASLVPADTFAFSKAQLRGEALARMDGDAEEAEAVVQLWIRRASDGWMGRYLESVTRR